MSDTVNGDTVRRWMETFSALLINNAGRLTDLDARIGDADHGANMARGAYMVRDCLTNSEDNVPSHILSKVGEALLEGIGGAAGPLYGSLVSGMATACDDDETLTLEQFSRALSAGVDDLATRGSAQLEDKTMYDSLYPAAQAIATSVKNGDSILAAASAARLAAATGLESTVSLQAKKGRASYLGPRSVGYLDPGAASAALLFDALAEAVLPIHSSKQGKGGQAKAPVGGAVKKFMNEPVDIVSDALKGFARAHPELVVHRSPDFVRRSDSPVKGKVALISGGGSGHEPMHFGFVGSGMLDVAVPGAVFASPSAPQIRSAAQSVATEAGVLFIVKNYTGDRLNFQMGADLLMAGGVPCEIVLVADDVAVENSTHTAGRRGTGATVLVEKIAGAAAEAGLPLPEVARIARAVAAASGSIGVALSSSTVPHIGQPNFTLGDDEVEFGVGIHGEPGRRRRVMAGARELVAEMADAVTAELGLSAGDRLAVIVNGLGATPLIELYVMFGDLVQYCDDRKLVVERSLVGNFVTSLDMAGCTITLTKLDDEMLRYWDAPVNTPALRW